MDRAVGIARLRHERVIVGNDGASILWSATTSAAAVPGVLDVRLQGHAEHAYVRPLRALPRSSRASAASSTTSQGIAGSCRRPAL